jgi:hypothetical protein
LEDLNDVLLGFSGDSGPPTEALDNCARMKHGLAAVARALQDASTLNEMQQEQVAASREVAKRSVADLTVRAALFLQAHLFVKPLHRRAMTQCDPLLTTC